MKARIGNDFRTAVTVKINGVAVDFTGATDIVCKLVLEANSNITIVPAITIVGNSVGVEVLAEQILRLGRYRFVMSWKDDVARTGEPFTFDVLLVEFVPLTELADLVTGVTVELQAIAGYLQATKLLHDDVEVWHEDVEGWRDETLAFRNEAEGFKTTAGEQAVIATGAASTATTQAGLASGSALTASQQAVIATEAAEQIVTDEAARQASELIRVSNENQRIINEGDSLSGRVKAENDRVAAEGLRATAEGQRDTAEDLRISAETTRGENEGIRISNENLRIAAESARNVASNMYNVTLSVPLGSGYYTLTTAIAAVPVGVRKNGLCLTFEVSAGVWETWQFVGGSWVVGSFKNINYELKEKVSINNINIDGIIQTIDYFIMGDWRGTGGVFETSTLSASTSQLVYLRKGDFISCDSRYKFLLSLENGSIYLAAWKTSYRATEDKAVYIEVRNTAGTILTSPELTELNTGSIIKITKYSNKECFISTTGSDSNDGLTRTTALATIAAAISYGFRNICILDGSYTESLNIEDVNNLRIYADNYMAVKAEKTTRPTFKNGSAVSSFNTDANNYKYFSLSNIPTRYTSVFISKTLAPVITSGSGAGSYNAGLWANYNNEYDDIKLKPVLTYAELTEANTFYFDGTNVYFNATVLPNTVTVVRNASNMWAFNKCNNLFISGINIQYAIVHNLYIQNSTGVRIENGDFAYTLDKTGYLGSCVASETTDITLVNCRAYKAIRDGFNGSYFGLMRLVNCNGSYNYDDGESSHNYCNVIVDGGEYAYNVKGGHAPVNGCKFTCNGTYTHHNGYGFYLVGDASHPQIISLISNSVSLNNITTDFLISKYIVNCINVKYLTHTENTGGILNNLTV